MYMYSNEEDRKWCVVVVVGTMVDFNDTVRTVHRTPVDMYRIRDYSVF